MRPPQIVQNASRHDEAGHVTVVSALLLALCEIARAASAESVIVVYRSAVDLKPFQCQQITRSSVIQRVCYDNRESYMLISLNGT